MPETASSSGQHAGLIRIGGATILVSFAIHIFVNFVLKEFPSIDLSQEELNAYFARESETWALAHGLRYAAAAGIAVFAGALYTRVSRANGSSASGWEVVGLIGAVLHVASLFITNGIETFAFHDFTLLSEQPDLFWLVFNLTRVLFAAEVAAWAIFLFGFSVAGWLTGRLPRLISALGLISAAACLLSGIFIGSVLSGGAAEWIIQVAELTALLWFLSVGAFMLARGDT